MRKRRDKNDNYFHYYTYSYILFQYLKKNDGESGVEETFIVSIGRCRPFPVLKIWMHIFEHIYLLQKEIQPRSPSISLIFILIQNQLITMYKNNGYYVWFDF